MGRQEHGTETRQDRLLWAGGILICASLSIIAAVAITYNIVVEKHMPKAPYVEVTHAHLIKLDYDNNGHLHTKINLTVIAKNDDPNSVFEYMLFLLHFPIRVIGDLKVHAPNSSLPQNYVLNSWNASVGDFGTSAMEDALNEGKVPFFLSVYTNVKWRFGSQQLDSKDLHVFPLDIALPHGLQ